MEGYAGWTAALPGFITLCRVATQKESHHGAAIVRCVIRP